MKQVNTTNGYLVIERNGGLDVYMDDVFVCELHGKTLAHFSYDEKVDVEKLDDAIEEELDTIETINKLNEY